MLYRKNMKMYFIFICFISIFHQSSAFEAQASNDDITLLNRSDNIPKESVEDVSDTYLEGYIQALLDMHYYEFKVFVIVKNKHVSLYNLPKNELLSKSIIAFVKEIPGVKEVKIPIKSTNVKQSNVLNTQIKGIWFPQSTELYQPMVADPRQLNYSIGYRSSDKVIGNDTVAISFGDDFPIFRWLNVLPWQGDLQIGLEGGIWSVFNVNVKGYNPQGGAELVNTDYYIGIPISYAVNKWSFKFRIYHISSHLGDEFLVNHPEYVYNAPNPNSKIKRRNPSYEAIDFFSSIQISDAIRIYVGPGFILNSDKSFPMQHYYVEYGGEVRFWGTRMHYHKLHGNFFLAAHFRNYQYLNWDLGGTGLLGYEWSKLQGIGRKIRMFFEYHNGFSLEGQFMNEKTSYYSLKVSYGF